MLTKETLTNYCLYQDEIRIKANQIVDYLIKDEYTRCCIDVKCNANAYNNEVFVFYQNFRDVKSSQEYICFSFEEFVVPIEEILKTNKIEEVLKRQEDLIKKINEEMASKEYKQIKNRMAELEDKYGKESLQVK